MSDNRYNRCKFIRDKLIEIEVNYAPHKFHTGVTAISNAGASLAHSGKWLEHKRLMFEYQECLKTVSSVNDFLRQMYNKE